MRSLCEIVLKVTMAVFILEIIAAIELWCYNNSYGDFTTFLKFNAFFVTLPLALIFVLAVIAKKF